MNKNITLEKCANGYLLVIGDHKILLSERDYTKLKNLLISAPLNVKPTIRNVPNLKKTGSSNKEKGIWSRDYDYCKKCGTSTTPYKANGMCTDCYSAWLSGKRKKEKKQEQVNNSNDMVKIKCNGCSKGCIITTDIPINKAKTNLVGLETFKNKTIEDCEIKID